MPTRRERPGSDEWVPDLARIARDRWPQALIPLSRRLRTSAAIGRGLPTDEIFALTDRLPPSPSEAAWAAVRAGQAVPVPGAMRSRAGRQVNVRLQAHEHERLQRAAAILGARPSQVVRMLVLNGVRRVLAEHDAVIAAAASPSPSP